MKIKHIFSCFLVILLIFASSGCDTWEENINLNPNDPPALDETNTTDYEPSQFMLDMIWYVVASLEYIHWNVMPAVCEYHGKTLSLSQGNRHQAWHAFDDASWNGPWGGGYTAVRYIKKMRNAAQAMGDVNYLAIANIWECYDFFNLTLLYGDIPYSETIMDETPIDPVYDKQEEIYFKLIEKLKAAGESIEKSSMVDSQTDMIFSGDMLKWKKFANTLLIRYAMYLYEAAPEEATALINEIMADPNTYPVMESNADNASFHYDGSQYKSLYYTLSSAKMNEAPFSNIFIERLISLKDPRLPVYARPVQYVHTNPECNVIPSNEGTDKYAGQIYGITTDNAYASSWNNGSNYASKLGTYFRTEDDKGTATKECSTIPLRIATYAEMNFFLAEAVEREILSSEQPAKSYYEEAINASFDQYNATFTSEKYNSAYGASSIGSVEEYLSQASVDYDGERDQLTLIAEQKWIASFLLSFEPYYDHRRTMLPRLRASSGAEAYVATGSGSKFPARSDYPSSEQSTNSINVANANNSGFDIPVTGQSDRNLALMWLLQPKGSDFLQMPVFQEPNYKSEYPCREGDEDYGTEFKSWYDNNWNTMFWWKNNDQ